MGYDGGKRYHCCGGGFRRRSSTLRFMLSTLHTFGLYFRYWLRQTEQGINMSDRAAAEPGGQVMYYSLHPLVGCIVSVGFRRIRLYGQVSGKVIQVVFFFPCNIIGTWGTFLPVNFPDLFFRLEFGWRNGGKSKHGGPMMP